MTPREIQQVGWMLPRRYHAENVPACAQQGVKDFFALKMTEGARLASLDSHTRQ